MHRVLGTLCNGITILVVGNQARSIRNSINQYTFLIECYHVLFNERNSITPFNYQYFLLPDKHICNLFIESIFLFTCALYSNAYSPIWILGLRYGVAWQCVGPPDNSRNGSVWTPSLHPVSGRGRRIYGCVGRSGAGVVHRCRVALWRKRRGQIVCAYIYLVS